MIARALTLLAAAGTLVVGVAACGGDDDGSGGSVELSWFIFNEPSGAFSEAAKKCSQESNGRYEIEFEFLPAQADQQREQLVRRLGAEDSTIDIIGLDVIWTAEFANAGWLREWTGERADRVTKNVFDSVVDTASYENRLYSAPYTSNTELLWYRKDRVDSPPETWEEMIREGERIGADGTIQVQANRYEGFTVWVNALVESAGTQFVSGPTEVELDQQPTEEALAVIGRLAGSSAAPANIATSTEDTARLGFETGDSTFMINYPFVYPSAKENAPEVFKEMAAAKYPKVVANMESRPPLGGINLGVSEFSEHPEEAFAAVECLVQPENQITAAQLGGLPPTDETVYDSKEIEEAYPGFSDLIKQSIEDAGPRPLTPAYQDLSLAIQRSLHPPDEIDPDDPAPTYDELYDNVDKAVNREGLL